MPKLSLLIILTLLTAACAGGITTEAPPEEAKGDGRVIQDVKEARPPAPVRREGPSKEPVAPPEPSADATVPAAPVPEETVERKRTRPPAEKRPAVKTYEVREGETLWTIAARPEVYGDALLWPLLYQANRDQIKDPRQIYPQQELIIRRDFTPEEAEAAREKARRSEIFPLEVLQPPGPSEIR